MPEIRAFWPFLTKDAQKYILCWETLAQLALLQCAYESLGATRQTFLVPSGSDNTSAEAAVNKQFATTVCMHLVASQRHSHAISLQVSHIAGPKNTWADEFGRDDLARFQHRPDCRIRVPLSQPAFAGSLIQLHPPHARWSQPFRTANSHQSTAVKGPSAALFAMHFSTCISCLVR